MRCKICGGLMYPEDRSSFKCKNAFKKSIEKCWNHVDEDAQIARERVLDWLLKQWERFPHFRERAIEVSVAEFARRNKSTGQELAECTRLIVLEEKQSQRLAKAISKTDEIEALVEELQEVNDQFRTLRRKHEALLKVDEGSQSFFRVKTSRTIFKQRLCRWLAPLFNSPIFSAKCLRNLSFKPIQAIDSGLVRPRAHVTLAMSASSIEQDENVITNIHGVIDLFEPPDPITYLRNCLEAKQWNPE